MLDSLDPLSAIVRPPTTRVTHLAKKCPPMRTKVDDLCARIGAPPVVDARTPEEILGYDAFGIPG